MHVREQLPSDCSYFSQLARKQGRQLTKDWYKELEVEKTSYKTVPKETRTVTGLGEQMLEVSSQEFKVELVTVAALLQPHLPAWVQEWKR